MSYILYSSCIKQNANVNAHFDIESHVFPLFSGLLEYAMANVVCEYANDSPTRPTSSAAGSINMEDHPDYSGRSMSPPSKRFASDNSYYSGMSEPGRRIRRSESLLRQAADSVSKGQTFQTVSDMFQIPISTIRCVFLSRPKFGIFENDCMQFWI